MVLVWRLMGKGDYLAALDELRQRAAPGAVLPDARFIGYIEARAGNPGEARKILRQLQAESRRGQFVSPGNLALVYMGLGDADEVFRYRKWPASSRNPTWFLPGHKASGTPSETIRVT